MITWSRFTGWNFNPSSWDRFHTLRLHREIKFHPGKVEQFSPGICVGISTFSFSFLLQVCVNYCFIPLRGAEAITQKNFVLAKRDPNSLEKGSHLTRIKFFTCNRKVMMSLWWVYNTLPAFWQNGTEFHPCKLGSCNHHLSILQQIKNSTMIFFSLSQWNFEWTSFRILNTYTASCLFYSKEPNTCLQANKSFDDKFWHIFNSIFKINSFFNW